MRRLLSLLLTLAAFALTQSSASDLVGRAWRSVDGGRVARGMATPAPLDAGNRIGARAPTWVSEAAMQPSPPIVVSVVRPGNPAPDGRSPRHATPIDLTVPVGPAAAAVPRRRSARTSRLATEFALAARGTHAPFFSTAPPPPPRG